MTDRPGTGLQVGREPSGATWVVFRYRDDWEPPPDPEEPTRRLSRPPDLVGLTYDRVRGVVELEALPTDAERGEDGFPKDRRLPLETVVAADGTQYRSDPGKHQVLRRGPDGKWTPIPCFGGLGRRVGQLRRPQGLAVDPRGYLLVADSGNHRVQVVRPEDGTVAAVLGCQDVYGRWIAGVDRGAMKEPVDVAVDPCTCAVYVADRRGGRIHVYTSAFEWVRSFAPQPSATRPPEDVPWPVAVDVEKDGTLLVADTTWGSIIHVDATGRSLGDVPVWSTTSRRFAGIAIGATFEPEGSAIIGPLDSGRHGVAWHEVHVELELPPGTSVSVRTWASDSETASPSVTDWAPEAPVPMGTLSTEPLKGELARLVLANPAGPEDGTDRGRYLWVKLTLTGRTQRPGDTVARATPSVRGLRATFPRPALTRWLPARWSERESADPAGALFAERYLALFERVLNDAETRYEDLGRLLGPSSAPAEWLTWIATWLDLSFDPSWQLERRRELVRSAMGLFRQRGTVAGLRRYIEIYSGRTPEIVERYTMRIPRRALALDGSQPLGGATLGTEDTPVDPDEGAHEFDVYAYAGTTDDATLIGPVIQRIVEVEKPAHTLAHVVVVLPNARVGMQSTVGLDLVLGHGEEVARPLCPSPTDGDAAPILGLLRLPGTTTPERASTPRLDEAGIPLDDTFRLS